MAGTSWKENSLMRKRFRQNRFWSDRVLCVSRDFGFLSLETKSPTEGNAVPIRKRAFIFQKTCPTEVAERGGSSRLEQLQGQSFHVMKSLSGRPACALPAPVPQPVPTIRAPATARRHLPLGPSLPLATGLVLGFCFFFYSLVSERENRQKLLGNVCPRL